MDYSKAIDLGNLVDVAYSRKLLSDPPYALPAGVTLLAELRANDLITKINPISAIVPYGFIARKGPDIYVVFRGTDSWLEWLDDIQFFSKPCPIPNVIGRTEDGFTDVYMSCQAIAGATSTGVAAFVDSVLTSGDEIYVCGHSLGAALATLAAVDIATNSSVQAANATLALYSYASPNVGDNTFAQNFESSVHPAWRIVNPFDIVTHVPTRFILGYQAVGMTIPLNPQSLIKKELGCLHALSSYLYLLAYYGAKPLPAKTNCMP